MSRALIDMIGEANATAGGTYLRDGRGRVIINNFYIEKKSSGRHCIFEGVIERSEKVAVMSLLQGKALDVEPNEPGTGFSVVVPLDNPRIKSGPGNVKSIILSIIGKDESAVSKDEFRKMAKYLLDLDEAGDVSVSSDQRKQPGRGLVLDYQTYRKVTRDPPQKELVLPKWTHVPKAAGNSPEERQARRAKLEQVAA